MTERCYIPRGGEQVWVGPSVYSKATLFGFAVPVDSSCVHEMLTRTISWPSKDLGWHLDVRGTTLEHAFFLFLESKRSQRPLSGEKRSGEYLEKLFAILVFGYRVNPEPGLILYAPYVFASDTPAWSMEREIYGSTRQHGVILPDTLKEEDWPARLSLSANTIEKFRKDEIATEHPILDVCRRGPGQRVKPFSQWWPFNKGLPELIANELAPQGVQPIDKSVSIGPQPRLDASAGDESFSRRPANCFPTLDLARALRTGSLRMLFLKQFRDIAYPDLACHQSIVEVPFTIKGVSGTEGPPYELDLFDLDSLPIRRELGIDPGTVKVKLAFRADAEELAVGRAKTASNPYWNPATRTDGRRRPVYIDRGGEMVWRQPCVLSGARIYGFGVKVPATQQHRFLQRYINEVVKADPDSTYGAMPQRPFELCACTGVDMVMLLFIQYDELRSGNDDDKALGGTTYREFLAMQLAISLDDTYPELDWFIPFIYLDVDAPRLAGREIYGYPKQLGEVLIIPYETGGAAQDLHLESTAIRNKKDSKASRETVIRVMGPAEPPRVVQHYTSAQDMFWDLWEHTYQRENNNQRDRVFPYLGGDEGTHRAHHSHPHTGDGGPGVEVINAVLLNNIGNVFLKQFRASENPERVCYQAVCKTDTVPATFRRGEQLDPSAYEIHLTDLASEPLLEYIYGSSENRPRVIKPAFAYWLDMDFELTTGRVIANPLRRSLRLRNKPTRNEEGSEP